jgi:hypothetical protein
MAAFKESRGDSVRLENNLLHERNLSSWWVTGGRWTHQTPPPSLTLTCMPASFYASCADAPCTPLPPSAASASLAEQRCATCDRRCLADWQRQRLLATVSSPGCHKCFQVLGDVFCRHTTRQSTPGF